LADEVDDALAFEYDENFKVDSDLAQALTALDIYDAVRVRIKYSAQERDFFGA
jgi:hypothetical protein